jgi:glucuronate isomerase
MTVGDILKKFKVEYIATTDDPASPLAYHGTYGDTQVSPTFRPDSALGLDPKALAALAAAAEVEINTLDDLKKALVKRLDYFNAHGCRIADHGMDFLPAEDCGEEAAKALFAKGACLNAEEKHLLFSHLLAFLAEEYTKRGMVMQLHFATYRCVNSAMLPITGKDSGFDIMRGHVDTDRLVVFLDSLSKRAALPRTVLYTLNPACAPSLATLTGAFPTVRVGAAWWFSDTVLGIKRQLQTVAEYAVLGTNLGMLTDSRSFASYTRFDFFRRILADVVGGYVERGEYDLAAAKELMVDVCYRNVKEYLGL